jgi:flagellar protein FliS
MFATAAYSTMNHRQAGAYKQVHLTTGVSSASPHALVSMLFDGLFDALARARGAMRSGNVEAKGKAISHAVGIVGEGLRASLNLTDGGALAANLDGLYGYVSIRLVQANLGNDEAVLDECVQLLTPVRDAWSQIASQSAPA